MTLRRHGVNDTMCDSVHVGDGPSESWALGRSTERRIDSAQQHPGFSNEVPGERSFHLIAADRHGPAQYFARIERYGEMERIASDATLDSSFRCGNIAPLERTSNLRPLLLEVERDGARPQG